MNAVNRITANSIFRATNRPVYSFKYVCADSKVPRKGIINECARIIGQHGGSVLMLVQPGFYRTDSQRRSIISGMGTQNGRRDIEKKYEGYRDNLEILLKQTRVPLFLFIEDNKRIRQFQWVFEASKAPLTLVVRTANKSPKPLIRSDVAEDLNWVHAISAMKFDLGIKNIVLAGEYYFNEKHIENAGCVGLLSSMLEGQILHKIDINCTFPNSSKKPDLLASIAQSREVSILS